MAINENIVTGRKFRKLADEANKLWQRISFWTKASDVEFDDGSTAEIKVGAINGVTDSLTSTSSNIAASAAAVKALNDKVTELSSNLELGYKLYATNVSLPWTPPAEITDYIIIPRYISCYNVGGVSGNNGSATSNVAVHGNGSLEYNNGSVQIAADDRFRMWCGAFNGDPSFSINFTKGDIYVKTI